MGRGGRSARAGRGSSRHSAIRRDDLHNDFVPFSSNHQSLRQLSQSYSLKEEARNTELHHCGNSDLKLRHTKVAFISAHNSGSDELKDMSEGMEGDCENFFTRHVNPEEVTSMADLSLGTQSLKEMLYVDPIAVAGEEAESARDQEKLRSLDPDAGTKQDVFFMDVKGSNELENTSFPPPLLRCSPSIAASDSSEEVILFSGRNRSRPRHDTNPKPVVSSRSTLALNSDIRIDKDVSRSTIPSISNQVKIIEDPIAQDVHDAAPARSEIPDKSRFIVMMNEKPRKRNGRVELSSKLSRGALEEEEILADYILNTNNSKESNDFSTKAAFYKRDLVNMDEHQHTVRPLSQLQRNVPPKMGTGRDSTEYQDLNQLRTSGEVHVVVEQILSTRTQPSGVQYLVIWEGFTIDDARWVSLDYLTSPSAKERIHLFEIEQEQFCGTSLSSDGCGQSSTMGNEVAADVRDEVEDMEDELDLIERKMAKMTDEKIAQLLSRQEELILDSDKLFHFDGEEENGLNWEEESPTVTSAAVWSQNTTRGKRTHRSRNEFPSDSALTDVLGQDSYTGFDVMDSSRQSLRKRPKGRRGILALELSDSDFGSSINLTWDKDRNKKKIRKQEREELRAQGLLGKNRKKLDLKAKYAEGIALDAIKVEMKAFLASSAESLHLPPMPHKDRKLVHEMANALKLHSKSAGGGKSRSPILHKTSRTAHYDEDALGTIEIQLGSGRFMSRMAKRSTRGSTGLRRGRSGGGGGASAGVSYRDGEVVGAAAPELGQENRGRAMLEKMGWSTGTALGASNNKGIMQPVTHIVKTTKAGLG